MIKKYLRKIYTPLAWTIFIQVLFCLPGTSLPSAGFFGSIEHFDKIVHFIFFAGFVSLWCYYFARKGASFRALKITFFVIWLIAVTNGIVVEYIQYYFIPFRSFDEKDIIADMLGASVVYGLCNILFLKEQQ